MLSALKNGANLHACLVPLRRAMSSRRGKLGQGREDYERLWKMYAANVVDIPTSKRVQLLIEEKEMNWNAWKDFFRPLRARFVEDPVSFVDKNYTGAHADFFKNLRLNKPSKHIRAIGDFFVQSVLLPLFIRGDKVEANLLQGSSATDLRAPHEWYPETRSMVRKVVFHCGPTNSGKTYHALRRLSEVQKGGLYCGPLRLLAHEVYETLNKQGVATNLRTGQEVREVPDATHVSSTIEMVNLSQHYEVAVIDEIQMLGDLQRGNAWSRTLLGVKAAEVHICGGAEALPVVEALLASTEDTLEVIRYERATPLQVEETSLMGNYSQIQPGDCIVAFSKKDIFSIRREIEERTNLKCAVVYGALPPETRAAQARLFNEENTGYDVLVASDAIGMGLNLNIRRIVFHTTAKLIPKLDGSVGLEYITPTQIKQIAGRAGRMLSKYDVGKVTSWQEVDLAYVRAVMQHDVPDMQTAGILPSQDQVIALSHFLDNQTTQTQAHTEESALIEAEFSIHTGDDAKEGGEPEDNIELLRLLKMFVNRSQKSQKFHLCVTNDMLRIAMMLDALPLSLGDKFCFLNSPLGKTIEEEKQFLQWMGFYGEGHVVPLGVTVAAQLPQNNLQFSLLCGQFGMLDLYLWLEIRYPLFFRERELCLEQREIALRWIDAYLQHRPASQANNPNPASYLHHQTYQEARSRLKGKRPAAQYPHIEQSVRQHLSEVAKEDLVLVPGPKGGLSLRKDRDGPQSSPAGKKKHKYSKGKPRHPRQSVKE